MARNRRSTVNAASMTQEDVEMADKASEEIAAEAEVSATLPQSAEVSVAKSPAPVEAPAGTMSVVRVRAVAGRYYNPYTRQMFEQHEEVDAPLDGFLQSQLDAGYIAKV